MPRPPDHARRAALLDALIDEYASGGIGTRSLRDVAEAVGTSHRMLLHHFGSREELLVEIVEEVERRQRVSFSALPADPADAFAAMWADLRRSDLRPFERLFFEVYARAAQGEEPFNRLLPGAVDDWLGHTAYAGVDPAMVRLGLAVSRGLLLDLAATDDDGAVDAAAARFVDLLRATRPVMARQSSPRRRRARPSI